jgi:hypothetical protein
MFITLYISDVEKLQVSLMNTSFIMQYAQLEKQAVSEPDADL